MYNHQDVGTISAVNAELEKIEQAFTQTVARVPEGSRTMEAALDMNSNRILNLPAPVQGTEPVRLMDIQNGVQIDTSVDLTLIRSASTPAVQNGAMWFDTVSNLRVGDQDLWKSVVGQGAIRVTKIGGTVLDIGAVNRLQDSGLFARPAVETLESGAWLGIEVPFSVLPTLAVNGSASEQIITTLGIQATSFTVDVYYVFNVVWNAVTNRWEIK